jgi:hypothetical protein
MLIFACFRRAVIRRAGPLATRTQTRTVIRRRNACIQLLSLVGATLLVLSLVVAGQTKDPTGTKLYGAYYVAYRTPAHVSRSTPEVFHEIANETLDLLKKNDVNVVADPERGTIETSESFSLESLLSLTGTAGATSLLYVTVDRPATSWLKVTLQCYDLSGKLLWEEHASASGGLSGKGAPSKTIESLGKKLLLRIGQPGLPMVQRPAQPNR